VQDEPVEHPAQRHLRCPQRLRVGDLPGHRSAQRGDALDELGLRASYLERGLDRLTLGQQRVEVSLGLSLVRLGRGSDALVPLDAEPFPQRCIAP